MKLMMLINYCKNFQKKTKMIKNIKITSDF